jgi:hypothetical protein
VSRDAHRRIRTVVCAAASSALGSASAQSDPAVPDAPPGVAPRWGFEIKRQNTDRGSPGESTKTTLRFETYPEGQAITLLRLDLPFPDAQSDFSGSAFQPRLGDIKVRAVWKALHWGDTPWAPRAELTFPTANPESLGSGKPQLMVGARTSGRLMPSRATRGEHELFCGVLAQQTVSLAGSDAAKDINYTKFELELIDQWRHDYRLKATLKPVIDWVSDGRTGAVFELEGGIRMARGWHDSLMAGTRAWGGAVPSTYGKRVELTLGLRI